MIDKDRRPEDDEDDLPENESEKVKDKSSAEGSGDDDDRILETEDGHQSDEGTEDEREALREQKRQERKEQKQRQRAARQRKDAELQVLRTQVANLTVQLKDINRRQTADSASDLDAAISGARSAIDRARAEIASATVEKDGLAVARATDELTDAKLALTRLESYKQSLTRRSKEDDGEEAEERGAPQSRKETAPRGPDQAVVNNVNVFRQRFSWWNPQGGDEDSNTVLRIDQEVHEDGFDPRTRDYWMEVEARMKDVIPHRFDKARTNGTKARPITGGSRDGGGRGDAKAPAVFEGEIGRARVEALKEAGMYDDPAKRKKLIAAYAEIDKTRNAR